MTEIKDIRRNPLVRHLRVGWRIFWRQLAFVLQNPVFAVLTVIGNLTVLIAAAMFYAVESGHNSTVDSYGDALWWAVATITTVGYGDIYPVTASGRIIAAVLMFTGGALFFSFLGLLSGAFVKLGLHELEDDIHKLERTVRTLYSDDDLK